MTAIAPWIASVRPPPALAWLRRRVLTPAVLLGSGAAITAVLSSLAVDHRLLIFGAIGGLVAVSWVTTSPQTYLPGVIPLFLLTGQTTAYRSGLLIGVLGVAAWLGGWLHRWWSVQLWPHLALAVLAGWLYFTYLIAVLPTPQPGRLGNTLQLLTGIGLAAAAASMRVRIRDLLWGTSAAAIACSAFLLIWRSSHGPQPIAFQLNANSLGQLIALGIVAMVSRFLTTKNFLWLAGLVLCAGGLQVVRSRESLIIVAVGLGALFVVGRSRRVQVVVVVAVAALALSPLYQASVNSLLGNRVHQNLAHSNARREDAAHLAIRYAEQNPLVGIGLDTFEARSGQQATDLRSIATHDDYLRLAAEAGVPGVLLFLLVALPPLFGGAPDEESHGRRAVLAGFLTGLFFGNTLAQLAVSAPFWLLLGSALGSARPRHGRTLSSPSTSERAPSDSMLAGLNE